MKSFNPEDFNIKPKKKTRKLNKFITSALVVFFLTGSGMLIEYKRNLKLEDKLKKSVVEIQRYSSMNKFDIKALMPYVEYYTMDIFEKNYSFSDISTIANEYNISMSDAVLDLSQKEKTYDLNLILRLNPKKEYLTSALYFTLQHCESGLTEEMLDRMEKEKPKLVLRLLKNTLEIINRYRLYDNLEDFFNNWSDPIGILSEKDIRVGANKISKKLVGSDVEKRLEYVDLGLTNSKAISKSILYNIRTSLLSEIHTITSIPINQVASQLSAKWPFKNGGEQFNDFIYYLKVNQQNIYKNQKINRENTIKVIAELGFPHIDDPILGKYLKKQNLYPDMNPIKLATIVYNEQNN